MTLSKLCQAGLLVLIVASATTADEFNPAQAAVVVAPFVGEETLFVVRVSIRNTEVDRLFEKFGDLIPMSPEERGYLAEQKAEMAKGLKKWEAAGGKDYYAAGMPFVVIMPLSPGADRKAIAGMFPPEHVVEDRGLALISVESRDEMDALKAMKIVERPELPSAIGAAGDGLAQFVILPPRTKKAGKIVTDQGPLVALSSFLKGAPEGSAVDKLVWIAVGVDLKPHAGVRLTIQCKDAEGAKELHGEWLLALGLASKALKGRATVADLDALMPKLRPKIEEDRLVWSLDERDKQWDDLMKFLAKTLAGLGEHEEIN